MQNKLAFPAIAVSIILVVFFAVLSWNSQSKTHSLTVATGGKNGEYYAFAKAFSEVVSRHQPRIKIEVMETEGSRKNLELLKTKQADLALVQSDLSIPPQTEAVAFLFPEMFHLIAREESNINRVGDLKGKRIALMPKGSGSYNLFWVLTRHYGLTPDDFEAISVSPEQAYTLLNQGKVDALFRVIALGNAGISELLRSGENRLVPLEQGEALQLFQPAFEASTIPLGTYNGSVPIPTEDLPVVGVRALLIADKNTDKNVIYEITRILFEARHELIAKTPQAALIHQPESLKDFWFSFHPGAKNYYYQDEPTFLEKYAEPMGFVLSASVLGISSLWQFRLWLRGRQKNRADLYNLELLSLIDKINFSDSIKELKKIRRQLFAIFREVIVDLDKDRISSESFQSFTFTWEVAIASIRHQENLLRSAGPAQPLSKRNIDPFQADQNGGAN